MINKRQFCAQKLAKSANYASGAFFGKIHALKVMLVMTNYAKNYASKIYQTLVALREGYGYFLELHIARSFLCKIITQNEEKDFL